MEGRKRDIVVKVEETLEIEHVYVWRLHASYCPGPVACNELKLETVRLDGDRFGLITSARWARPITRHITRYLLKIE